MGCQAEIMSEFHAIDAAVVSFYFQKLNFGGCFFFFFQSLISEVLLLCAEYLQTGNLLRVQKRERPAIYKSLNARFRPFKQRLQLSLPS
jgi:hypothetical protein